ncbi:response regulator [Aurantiacibacter flavus]|uniref:Response regulator n=1 Tax=Aurantiacibacter flavus TaxID=3145232 RepID=A0ABV0CTN6_9SPHN
MIIAMTNILIVEDEFLIAMEMEAVVCDLGYRCAGVADDMKSAMEIAEKELDVALVDVNLADGATGPDIGARLANEFKVEVVFVTANPAQLGDGISGTLGAVEKPVDLAMLKDVLAYVLAVRQGKDTEPPAEMVLFE